MGYLNRHPNARLLFLVHACISLRGDSYGKLIDLAVPGVRKFAV